MMRYHDVAIVTPIWWLIVIVGDFLERMARAEDESKPSTELHFCEHIETHEGESS